MTFLIPPGSPATTGRAAPPRNTFPLNFNGAVTSHPSAEYVVVALVASGVNVTVVSGTTTEYAVVPAVNDTVPPSRCRLVVPVPRPDTLPTLENQSVSPAGIGVKLKLAAMDVAVGLARSSRTSRPSRGRRAGRELLTSRRPGGGWRATVGGTPLLPTGVAGPDRAESPDLCRAGGTG